LLALADRYRGVPVSLLPEHLGVAERGCRKKVEALVERGLVVVVDDPDSGDRRVWTPKARETWARNQRWAENVAEELKLPGPWGVTCDHCKHWIRTIGPVMRAGDVEQSAR